MLGPRPEQALALVRETCIGWRWLRDNLDAQFANYPRLRGDAGELARVPGPAGLCGARIVEERSARTAHAAVRRSRVRTDRTEFDAIHKRVLKSRVFVALHMHAGDGNVHTNIPVNSDDYAMLQQANEIVGRIMQLARSLGGVISGEHGIGITKLDYLEPAKLDPFVAYKRKVDPEGRFNRGQVCYLARICARRTRRASAFSSRRV